MPTVPEVGKHQPSCDLAHEVLNKLSIIVGSCDLMRDEVESVACLQRLQTIRRAALELADNLQYHQCHVRELIREAAKKTPAGLKSIPATQNMA